MLDSRLFDFFDFDGESSLVCIVKVARSALLVRVTWLWRASRVYHSEAGWECSSRRVSSKRLEQECIGHVNYGAAAAPAVLVVFHHGRVADTEGMGDRESPTLTCQGFHSFGGRHDEILGW